MPNQFLEMLINKYCLWKFLMMTMMMMMMDDDDDNNNNNNNNNNLSDTFI